MKQGVYQIEIYEIFDCLLLTCQNTLVRVCGAWLKYITFYVQKHITIFGGLF